MNVSIRRTGIYRYGGCVGCGECCTLYLSDERMSCPDFDVNIEKHCRVYGSRPKACREFPRGPMDLERVTRCGFWFTDERGRRVDGYMDKRVTLTKIGQIR